MIDSLPLCVLGSPTIKSIATSSQGQFEIGRGVYNPWYLRRMVLGACALIGKRYLMVMLLTSLLSRTYPQNIKTSILQSVFVVLVSLEDCIYK